MIWIEARKQSDGKPIGFRKYCENCNLLVEKYGEPDPDIKFDTGYFELAGRYRHTLKRCLKTQEEIEQSKAKITDINKLHGGGFDKYVGGSIDNWQ